MVKKKVNYKKEDPFAEREAMRYEKPIPSREFILHLLMEKGHPVKAKDINKYFGLSSNQETDAMERRLRAMVRECQITTVKAGYSVLTMLQEVRGVLCLTKSGLGYVEAADGQSVRINESQTRGYYHGDELLVRVKKYNREGKAIGAIEKLIKAVEATIVGRFFQEHGVCYVAPIDRKFMPNIVIAKKNIKGAQDGQIVEVKILRGKKELTKDHPCGQVIDVLGFKGSPGIEVQMAIRNYRLPHSFSKEEIQEAKSFGNKIPESATEDRKDLTDLPFVTIDGEDAKDFDDAVFCKQRSNGGWSLYVAIADVSYYVTAGSQCDVQARTRGNSVYFPDYVIPMLPEALSNGLCSLNPEVERLCVVCEMLIDSEGKMTRSAFYDAVICSKARLTYNVVADLLGGDKQLIKTHENLVGQISDLHGVFKVLLQQRSKRGAIDFDTVETQIIFNNKGKIDKIVPVERRISHRMIEECMLAANVASARFLRRHKMPFLYRVHDKPSGEKLSSLRGFLSELGLNLGGGKSPGPEDYSNLMHKIKPRADRHVIQMVMLRSLSQAVYSPQSAGHFGLAYEYYTHFTSPIRRYPDLLTHRAIKAVLAKKGQAKKIKEYKNEKLESLGETCSVSERRADEATREAVLGLKCAYMKKKVGQCFDGVISGVTSFGLFVKIKL